MNILIVASKFPPEYTGPGVRIPRLYEDIREELGINRVDVLCNGVEHTKNEDYEYKNSHVKRRAAAYIRENNFPFSIMPKKIKNALVFFAENIITLRALNAYNHTFDLIHIIGHSGGTAAALHWAKKNDVPVLMELVNATALPEQRFLFFSKVRPSNAFKIIVISNELKKKSMSLGFKEKDIWSRPNPVDEAVFHPQETLKETYRKNICPFANDDVVICSVAKFMPRKNQIFLLEVMPFLSNKYKLLLAGPVIEKCDFLSRDREYVSKIKNKIAKLKLEYRVHMAVGFVDSDAYIKASDVYALPAWDEGLGTPMLEALACGIPVVANIEEAAFQQWIKNGDNGFLSAIDNPQDWAKAIEKLAALSKDKRQNIAPHIHAQAGQKEIHQKYKILIKELTSHCSQ